METPLPQKHSGTSRGMPFIRWRIAVLTIGRVSPFTSRIAHVMKHRTHPQILNGFFRQLGFFGNEQANRHLEV